jgi:microtubule-associated protein-like 6
LSCSDDATLRVWDINKKEQVAWISLDYDANLKPRVKPANEKFLPDSCKGNSVAVAESGVVVVGCKDGTLRIYDKNYKPKLVQGPTSKAKVEKGRRSPNEVSILKFSPDQAVLAVGDHSGRITIYEWNNGSQKIKVRSSSIKHSSTIRNMDFSRDSNIIHATCTSYELLFWNVSTGKQLTGGATSTRDEEWATWTVTLGWPVQGIWEQEMDGSDINAVDRSHKTYGDKGMRLLASSDDRGQVRLLEYPCIIKNCESIKGRGHSSHVTNISFSNDDSRIFSTGGEDQTVLQWSVRG